MSLNCHILQFLGIITHKYFHICMIFRSQKILARHITIIISNANIFRTYAVMLIQLLCFMLALMPQCCLLIIKMEFLPLSGKDSSTSMPR